ncbi:MAG: zinc ribbon domain-containing protein [Planctomycetota bacterium]|nr:zinc ribbon domain-containing protein [Planctomycetota bacterium]
MPQCPRCQAEIAVDQRRCLQCGASLSAAAPLEAAPSTPDDRVECPPNRAGWMAWGVGAALALPLYFVPFGSFAAWLFSSLCHEMGHCAANLLTGSLAFPAISLRGHAVAMATEPIPFARVVIWGALIALAVGAWKRRSWITTWTTIAIIYPLIAWPMREVWVLYLGVFGELVFGGVFLWRAWTGGFTEQPSERPLYAMLGWLLVQRNLWLGGGLLFSNAARLRYWENGSFGLTNDLIRIAHDHLGMAISTAAIPLLLGALATPILAWWFGRAYLRSTD